MSSRWSCMPGTSCTFCQSVPPKATFISWKPRQTANSGMPAAIGARDQRQRRRVAMRVVQRARIARPARRIGAARRSTGCRSAGCRRRARAASSRSRSPSDGIRTGIASAASATAAMYFSPTQWKGCGPRIRRSAGMPISGLWRATFKILDGPWGAIIRGRSGLNHSRPPAVAAQRKKTAKNQPKHGLGSIPDGALHGLPAGAANGYARSLPDGPTVAKS